MNFVDQIHTIHRSLKPFMLRQAHKYRLHNPQDFVESWLAEAYLVARKFDSGEIPLMIDGTAVARTEFDKPESMAQFSRYLRTCFVNAALQECKSKQRTVYLHEDTKSACSANIRNFDACRLSHLLQQAKKDASPKSTSAADEVTRIFHECVATTLQAMIDRWGDIDVTADISNPQSPVDQEFRNEFSTQVLDLMLERTIAEPQPVLFDKLFNLVYSPAGNALSKRISRWFGAEDGVLKCVADAHKRNARKNAKRSVG